MKRFITGAMLLLATTFSVFSQTKNITVSGRVVEDPNDPAVQATIQLLSLPDSAMLPVLLLPEMAASLYPK